MPQVLHKSSQVWGDLYLWHVEEDVSFFEAPLVEAGLDVEHLRKWHPSRQKEWLSGRYLVHRYMDQDISSLEVDEHGKPGFQGSDQVISISHTDGLVGLQIHTVSHGLDLQIASDKIGRVAHKFCSEGDLTALSPYLDLQATQHFIWGLKECVYKAYGKKGLSYHDDIKINSAAPKGKIHLTSIELKRGELQLSYQGKLSRIGPYYISQVIEI